MIRAVLARYDRAGGGLLAGGLAYSALFAMSPAISRPSAQFIAYDSDFWKPKAAADVKALASKKEKAAPKPAEKQ